MHCTIIEIRSTTYKQQPQKICLLIATKVPPRLSSTLNQIVQNWHFRNFIIAWSLSLHLFFFCVLLLNWRQSHQSPWTSAESARALVSERCVICKASALHSAAGCWSEWRFRILASSHSMGFYLLRKMECVAWSCVFVAVSGSLSPSRFCVVVVGTARLLLCCRLSRNTITAGGNKQVSQRSQRSQSEKPKAKWRQINEFFRLFALHRQNTIYIKCGGLHAVPWNGHTTDGRVQQQPFYC